MKRFVRIGALSALLCASGVASATLTNPSFEAPLASPWTTTPTNGGSATVVSSQPGYTTTYGPAAANTGSDFLVITASEQDGFKNLFAEITQNFTLGASETLSGWFALDFGDETGFTPADAARVQVRQGSTAVFTQTITGDSLASLGTGPVSGPWTTWTTSALAAGNYTLALGVMNASDFGSASRALFDYEHTTTTDPCIANPQGPGCPGNQVPEPGTLALLGLGLAGLGYGRRRVKR